MVSTFNGCMLIALACYAACSSAAPVQTDEALSYMDYLDTFHKQHPSDQLAARQLIFEANLARIATQNLKYQAGNSTWFAGINQLTDLFPAELAQMRGHRKHMLISEAQLESGQAGNGTNPESMDWRTKGAITPVKNQGGCGSCWAFAATETVESYHFINSGKLLQLSPQALVDCVKNPKKCGGTGGCKGATAELGFELASSKGLPLAADLPYTGKDGFCKSYTAAAKVNGYTKLQAFSASALETALANTGPVAVSVAAGCWQLYRGGIYTGCTDPSSCPIPEVATDLDHAVQAVGYGVDRGKKYWLIRNSWGSKWGEGGYIRLSRDSDSKKAVDKTPAHGIACEPYPESQTIAGECGVLTDMAHPSA